MVLLTLTSDQDSIGSGENFSIKYSPTITLDETKRYEVALIQASIPYSWYNISAALGNNVIEYYNGTTWKTITLLDGQYELSDLEDAVHDYMYFTGGDYTAGSPDSRDSAQFSVHLDPIWSSGKVYLGLEDSFQVRFTHANACHEVLGFAADTYTTSTTSPNVPDFNNGVYACIIHCSLVQGGSYLNSSASDVLFSFLPNGGSYAVMSINPQQPVYIPMTGHTLDEIRMRLTDQDNNELNLNSEKTVYLLSVRERV